MPEVKPPGIYRVCPLCRGEFPADVMLTTYRAPKKYKPVGMKHVLLWTLTIFFLAIFFGIFCGFSYGFWLLINLILL